MKVVLLSEDPEIGGELHEFGRDWFTTVVPRGFIEGRSAVVLAGFGEADLDRRRGSLLVRRDKGGRRREVGMDEWAWEQLQPWLDTRSELPVGPLFCIVTGPNDEPPLAAAGGRAGDHRQRDLVDHSGAQPLDELANRQLIGRRSANAIRQKRRTCSQSDTSRTKVS